MLISGIGAQKRINLISDLVWATFSVLINQLFYCIKICKKKQAIQDIN